jgi:glycosyltransferase involved in cell wall biosynthesis
MPENVPIRVLHLVRSLDVGGLERVVLSLIEGMNRAGIRPWLGCLSGPGKWHKRAEVNETWYGRLAETGRLRTVRSLRQFVKERGINIIHSHNPEPHLFAVLASLFTNVSVIHTKHGRNYPNNRKRVWLNRQLARRTKQLVAVADDVAAVAVDIEGIPAEKVRVIRNGVDVDGIASKASASDITKTRAQLDIPAGSCVVGTVGRLSPEKNYSLLVRAVSGVMEDERHLVLLLVGDGPERSALEELARESGVHERVRFAGMRDDVIPLIAAMDIFCLSSITEGTSITLLEAAACGVPAIVTDVGGNREIVSHEKTGIVVPGENKDGLRAAIRLLVKDRSMRQRLGKSARERVATGYSLRCMADAYLASYREVLGENE